MSTSRFFASVAVMLTTLMWPILSAADDSRIGGAPTPSGNPPAGTPDTKGAGGEGGHSYGATVNVPTTGAHSPSTSHPRPKKEAVTDPKRD